MTVGGTGSSIYNLRLAIWRERHDRQRKYRYFRLMILRVGVTLIIYKEAQWSRVVNRDEIAMSGWADG